MKLTGTAMNLGGRPKGPSSKTLFDKRDAEERADPSKRVQRLEEEKDKKRQFLALFGAPAAKRTCKDFGKGQQSHPNQNDERGIKEGGTSTCLLYTSPSPRD